MTIQTKLSDELKKANEFFANQSVSQATKDAWIARYHKLSALHGMLTGEFYSSLVDEKFWFDDTDMVFESGVRYTVKDQQEMLGATKANIKQVHEAIRMFSGELIAGPNKLF